MKLTRKAEYQARIQAFENHISTIEGALFNDCFPLKHTFTDGIYTREIYMPKGYLVVSKIHKYEHPYFIMKGEVSVITEEGVKRISAPYQGVTPVGTKRMLYIHEDCVWVTVHTNPENITDLEKIEERIIAKSFDDVLPESARKFLEENRT